MIPFPFPSFVARSTFYFIFISRASTRCPFFSPDCVDRSMYIRRDFGEKCLNLSYHRNIHPTLVDVRTFPFWEPGNWIFPR